MRGCIIEWGDFSKITEEMIRAGLGPGVYLEAITHEFGMAYWQARLFGDGLPAFCEKHEDAAWLIVGWVLGMNEFAGVVVLMHTDDDGIVRGYPLKPPDKLLVSYPTTYRYAPLYDGMREVPVDPPSVQVVSPEAGEFAMPDQSKAKLLLDPKLLREEGRKYRRYTGAGMDTVRHLAWLLELSAAKIEEVEADNRDLKDRNHVGGQFQERCEELAAENKDLKAVAESLIDILEFSHAWINDPDGTQADNSWRRYIDKARKRLTEAGYAAIFDTHPFDDVHSRLIQMSHTIEKLKAVAEAANMYCGFFSWSEERFERLRAALYAAGYNPEEKVHA